MSIGFEIPSHDTLIAEQALVQAEKCQTRQLRQYNECMFPGQERAEPKSSAVADFVQPLVGDQRASLEAVLQGISETNPDPLVNWVDMGGGKALSMRQLAAAVEKRPWLQMTNVDLFHFGLKDLEPHEIIYLEHLAPGMTKPEAEPPVIMANIETVTLPAQADVITSIETMQYLNNPLEALANWYNQLTDNGLMFVATDHNWPSWIRYSGEAANTECDDTPMKHLLEILTEHDINFATTNEYDWHGERPMFDPNHFRVLAIQKKPETSLEVTQPVTDVWVNPWNYKVAYYEVPTDGTLLVEVTRSTAKNIGGISLAAAAAV